MNSNFTFLQSEWNTFFSSATEAEKSVNTAPRSCAFLCRYTLEQITNWLYNHDAYLHRPYRDNLASLIHEQTFRENLSPGLFDSIHFLWKTGNVASHASDREKPISKQTAVICLKHLHTFTSWFAKYYSKEPPEITSFEESLVPDTGLNEKSKEQLEKLQSKLQDVLSQLKEKAEENQALKEQVKVYKERNEQVVHQMDFNPDEATEEQTRNALIDLLLYEAGWKLDQPRDREYEVTGMPNEKGLGYVDYVLWGDDGKPLAVVEAKRSKVDPGAGKHQAKLYADCLEQMTGQRPLIFFTNGYETYFWDDCNYPPREVRGFYTKDQLQLFINRRSTQELLTDIQIDKNICNRYYQELAIKRVCESFENRERKSLLVMATGTGKTRTAIALVDILLKNNWAKRILFLADRNALVTQAKNAFTNLLPNISTINLTKGEEEAETTRIVFSTYPTMMNRIDVKDGKERLFTVGHFDLIIIDEAHRSIYKKYQAIFDYFDSLLIGLTATPKDEVDRNTYHMFDLEDGVPTYAYELDQAVSDKYLVPYHAVSVPIKFQREGIKYEDLSEEEKEEYEEKFYDDESDDLPDWIDPGKLNSWVFNEDTVDKVLTFLMEEGLKVEGGDRLGKTIIFAKNHKHAEFIGKRFDKLFPQHRGGFLSIIDNQVKYAQDVIDNFGKKNDNPIIAVSVDMLDTGIDVPEIVNLVFFKIVRSRAKFWQMIGRGTRLCEKLFSPAEDKESFLIFDFCENFEFFDQNPEGYKAPTQEGLAEKIFKRRLYLSQSLCRGEYTENKDHNEYRISLLDRLHQETVDMKQIRGDTLLVRPHRKYIDKFSHREKWNVLNTIDIDEIEHHIAPLALPEDEDELARRFDLLILNLQLCLIDTSPMQAKLISDIKAIAQHLFNKKMNIPAVAKERDTITKVLEDEFWKDVTVVQLESVRLSLRNLIKFIDKLERETVYTNFEDTIFEAHESPDITGGMINIAAYKQKVERFLRENMDHITIHKLRYNEPISDVDIKQLEKMLFEGDIGTREDFEKAYGSETPLGDFIRSIVGLEKTAVKEAFADFLYTYDLSADQIEFLNLIIDFLTETGKLEPEQLFEVPFTDIHYEGLMGVFDNESAKDLGKIVESIKRNAEVG